MWQGKLFQFLWIKFYWYAPFAVQLQNLKLLANPAAKPSHFACRHNLQLDPQKHLPPHYADVTQTDEFVLIFVALKIKVFYWGFAAQLL